MLRVNNLVGFGAGVDPVFQVVDSGTDSGTTIDVTGVNFGKPHANRIIAIGVSFGAGGGASLSYGTDQINGGAVTTHASTIANPAGGNAIGAAIFSASVATGGTGSFRVSLSRSGFIEYTVYRIITTSGSVTDTGSANGNTTDTLTLNLNCAAGDAVIVAGRFWDDGTVTPTGLDTTVINDGRDYHGFALGVAAATPRTVSLGSSVATGEAAGVSASFIIS